jgi:hypothetical protein
MDEIPHEGGLWESVLFCLHIKIYTAIFVDDMSKTQDNDHQHFLVSWYGGKISALSSLG